MLTGFAAVCTVIFAVLAIVSFAASVSLHTSASSGGDYGSVISDVLSAFCCLVGIIAAILFVLGAASLLLGIQ